jgi:hypothetical protein
VKVANDVTIGRFSFTVAWSDREVAADWASAITELANVLPCATRHSLQRSAIPMYFDP